MTYYAGGHILLEICGPVGGHALHVCAEASIIEAALSLGRSCVFWCNFFLL